MCRRTFYLVAVGCGRIAFPPVCAFPTSTGCGVLHIRETVSFFLAHVIAVVNAKVNFPKALLKSRKTELKIYYEIILDLESSLVFAKDFGVEI